MWQLANRIIAIIGMQIVSPTIWILTVVGITICASGSLPVFSLAAAIENGRAEALDIEVKAAIAGEAMVRARCINNLPFPPQATNNKNAR